MLTPLSYGIALSLYILAALVASVFVYRHCLKSAGPLARRILIGAMLGVLISPALPASDAETLAPALIVAVFNLAFVGGWSSAKGAFTVLALAGTLGMLAGAGTTVVSKLWRST